MVVSPPRSPGKGINGGDRVVSRDVNRGSYRVGSSRDGGERAVLSSPRRRGKGRSGGGGDDGGSSSSGGGDGDSGRSGRFFGNPRASEALNPSREARYRGGEGKSRMKRGSSSSFDFASAVGDIGSSGSGASRWNTWGDNTGIASWQKRSDRGGRMGEGRRVFVDHDIGGGGGDGDVMLETDGMVLFWKAPTCFAQWTTSYFKVDGVRSTNVYRGGKGSYTKRYLSTSHHNFRYGCRQGGVYW